MKASLLLDFANRLHIKFEGVEDTPQARGRICNIELDLLRNYQHHTSEAVKYVEDGSLTFEFIRERSSQAAYDIAKEVLAGYCIEV